MHTGISVEEQKVGFYEGEFLIKTLETESEWRQAYQLRHRVFAERLKWVPERADRLESDTYDAWSSSIGVFSRNLKLLGLVRMTHAPVPFMLESEFSSCLVGDHQVRKDLDTAEITRLAIDPAIADRGLSAKLMKSIFKGMYQWCLAHEVRYTYMVVEHRLLRVVERMGWPCHPIGEPVAIPPAEVLSIGALLDLQEFRENARVRRPEMLDWLTLIQPADTSSYVAITDGAEKDSEEWCHAEFAESRRLERVS